MRYLAHGICTVDASYYYNVASFVIVAVLFSFCCNTQVDFVSLLHTRT